MALRSEPVPMPEKRITFKPNSNGSVYVYYTLRAYRNKDGKPTSDEASIGKKDLDTGMLIPNRRYFELFQGPPEMRGAKTTAMLKPAPSRIASCGNAYALMEAATMTGLRGALEECFPGAWDKILAAAFYMLCEGNVMMYINDWFDETDVPFADQMDDQQCSRLFASIAYDERVKFFKKWVALRSESEYIAYDVTSVSTYSKGVDIAEWGYNRDSEKLPQVNIGMFYGAESFLPVCYSVYNGSVPDKSHLVFMMGEAEKLGVSSARFVLDRGFMVEGNIRYMAEKKHVYVTAYPGNFVEAKKIIDENKGDIRKAANRVSRFDVYAKPVDIGLYGHKAKAHIYFDAEKQALDEKELYAHIERLSADLEKIGKSKRVSRKHTEYFKVVQDKQEKFSFAPDNEKIDKRLSRAGFFILISNDEILSSEEVLRIYRGKDVIEKNFDQFKNGLDFKRLRTHVNRTTDGKIFVGFLALILRSFLLNKIKSNPETKHLTLEKVLIELRKIRTVTFEDLSRILMPLTKLQKTILKSINITPKKLIDSFAKN